MRRSFFPLFVDLRERLVIVVGGGRVAERKVAALLEAQARVRIVSPQLTDVLQGWVTKGAIEHQARPYRSGDLEGASLVLAATDDPAVQRAVFAEAEGLRIFCNTVDRPSLCSFIVPSTVRRGDLCFAISTGGQSPALARRLREELEQHFGPRYASYVEMLGRLRRLLLAEKRDAPERTVLLHALVVPDVLSWMEAEEWDRVTAWAVSLCGGAAEAVVSQVRCGGGASGTAVDAPGIPEANKRQHNK